MLGGLALPLRAQDVDATVGGVGATHTSIAAAIEAAPADDRPWRIRLSAGRWSEKLIVRRPNVAILGAGRDRSVLTAAHAAGHVRPDGQRWGTYGSATITVEAPGFAASDLTIENGFDYLADLATGASGGAQAVALALGPGADRSRLERCAILGHQDSFYLRAGRALLTHCVIGGGVDFIFGGAAALLRRCELRSRHRPGQPIQGYVAAPSTPREQPLGLVFDRCRLTREPGVGDASVYLGRPWRAGGDTSLLGFAAYLDCWMDAHIHPEGWTSMDHRGPGGVTVTLQPGDARFFEHGSRGSGGRRHPARRQLDVAGAARLRARASAIIAGNGPATQGEAR